MRVLFWADSFAPVIGGIETFGAHLLPRLRARGHGVLVLTTSPGRALAGHDCVDGVEVERVELPPIAAGTDPADVVRARQRVADIKRAFRADVYHLNLWGVGPTWHGVTADAHPAPTLITVHGPLYPPTTHAVPAVQRLLRQACWINTVSRAGLDDVLRHVPEYADRSSIVPLGLPASTLPVAPYPPTPLVAWCGRIVESKGLGLAIEAFEIVANRLPTARFVITGDGPDRDVHERDIARRGLGGRVVFAGAVALVAPQMNEASLHVMSSRSEGFGYVVLEAALQARPTVAPRIDGLVEAIADGESGLLVDPSPPALAEGILSLLGDPVRLQTMGAAARQRARADFGIDRMVDRYVALYDRVVDRGAPGRA